MDTKEFSHFQNERPELFVSTVNCLHLKILPEIDMQSTAMIYGMWREKEGRDCLRNGVHKLCEH